MMTALTAHAYQLRFAGAEGDMRTLAGTVSTTAPKDDGSKDIEKSTASLSIREQVRAVTGGSATVERTFSMVMKDRTEDILGIHYTALRTLLGEISQMVLKPKIGDMMHMPVLKADSAVIDSFGTTLMLPKDDVKIGDTWQAKGATQFVIDPTQILNGSYEITYKLIGVKDIDGKQCLQIVGSYTLSMPRQKIMAIQDDTSETNATFTGSTTFYFNAVAGAVQGMDINFSVKVKVFDGTTIKVDGALTMKGELRPVVTRL